MAPIMPFITEELYNVYYIKHEKKKSIHITDWPNLNLEDEHIDHIGDFFVEVVDYVRKQKSEKSMSLKTPVKKLTIKAKIEEKDFDELEEELKAATSAENIIFEPTRGQNPEKDVEIEVEF